METENKKPSENFPKIDTIWSEADENLIIKEEIVSDLETEPPISPTEDGGRATEVQPVAEAGNNKCLNVSNSLSVLNKKKLKTKSLKNEEIEIFAYNKLFCVHDPKNFKMVKRRLRCGDCRSLVCPECCKVMTPNLSSHFSGNSLNRSDVFVCRFCSIIFHSLCALQAHIRIHSMEIPYVCPDCGLIYNNIHFLILHLQNKCFHVYKTARYKCKNCPGLYFKAESFGQHVQEVHLECVFRCLYCSSLFTNHEEFNCHMSKLHQKQKAQYLNYYRCSLCSNMVIPQVMYEKHIAQHRDNPTLYEIHYQCVCGETFNVIGAFRAHNLYCNFKKILPYQWRFLQGKFKTQEVSHLDYYPKNDVSEPTNLGLKTSSESDSSALKPLHDKIEIEEKTNCMAKNGTNKTSDVEGDICTAEIERTMETNKAKDIKVVNSEPLKSNWPDWLEKETPTNEIPKVDSENLKNTNSDYVKIDMNENMEVIQDPRENGRMSKIYDHIPCDHLGYVIKTQCSEGSKKTSQVDCGEIMNVENNGSANYRIVTELDEKTGFVRVKSVPIDKFGNTEEDEELENLLYEDDYEEKQIENINEKQSSYRQKIKSNSIKCPFCTLMFPKHNLAFQQFKLHIDSNHPDAAINVTVNNEENMIKKDITENHDPEMEDIFSCNDTSREQSSGVSLNSINFSNMETDGKDNQTDNNNRNLTNPECQTDLRMTFPKKLIPEKQFSVNKIPCSLKKEKLPLFWNVSISINSSDQRRAEEYKETLKLGLCNNPLADKEVKTIFENEEIEMQKEKTRKSENTNLVDKTTVINDASVEDLNNLQNIQIATEETECVTVASEFDGEGDGSKNAGQSSVSVTLLMPDKEPKTEEREKSRRESEVWSELYESLMLAEKLKKKKSSPDSEGKRKSMVSDYSSKRIVKKPKRYGESSDSDESSENSDFNEFALDNDLFQKINSEEIDSEKTDKDGLTKKQKLLIKLENVDGRLADYLFDFITKKEKMFELYKKHSVPRAGHDLRSYRKKVLNGIKHRGRPFKVLRCDDSLKEKYPLQVDRANKEGIKKKEEYSPGSKTLEKKRGRPRKYQEVAKIKERRRSDKEVYFIEKNFEQDENELSPSKRKRKLSSKLQYYKNLSDEKDDFSSGQVITNKVADANKKFTCAVCKQTFLELNEFREHIIVHRTEENTYQCMECGECFVVRPSLEKHLHAFHKIKNTDKYIIDNQCCNIKKEEEEEEPLKENQCKVCKDQFDKASDLTKHFRIHGMAFLKEFKKDGKVK